MRQKFLFIALAIQVIGAGCSSGNESTLGKFGRAAHFPMYYITGGDTLGSGAIYKVNEVSVGQTVDSELLVTGINSPGGIIKDEAGNIFVTETLPSPQGRVLKLPPGKTELVEIITGLNYPTGLAIDSFNQLYIIENGENRVIKLDATGALSELKVDMGFLPEVGSFDSRDNLFVVESTEYISKLNPSGEKIIVSTQISGLIDAAIDPGGRIFALGTDSSLGTGEIFQVVNDSTNASIIADLVSPLAIAIDSANALYIAEGAPVNRISRYNDGHSSRRVIINTGDEPRMMTFSPN